MIVLKACFSTHFVLLFQEIELSMFCRNFATGRFFQWKSNFVALLVVLGFFFEKRVKFFCHVSDDKSFSAACLMVSTLSDGLEIGIPKILTSITLICYVFTKWVKWDVRWVFSVSKRWKSPHLRNSRNCSYFFGWKIFWSTKDQNFGIFFRLSVFLLRSKKFPSVVVNFSTNYNGVLYIIVKFRPVILTLLLRFFTAHFYSR